MLQRISVLARLCAVVVACATATAHAQSLRGTVFQPDSATRAAGIVVVAADERGDAVARTLSQENGDFDMRVPGAGRYTLRLLRVGYRPTIAASLEVPADGLQGVRAVLGAEPVVLSAVTVRSENVCGSTVDAGRVVAQLWEEARTALTATELSVGASAIDVEWQAFQFLMDREGARAREQSVLTRRGATERPFVSVSADSLVQQGYVVQSRSDILYRAPDAAVLLSDQFAATHCFQVEPITPGRSHWVGVAFRPTPARGKMRDITGTLWLDRATAELRLLEYRYTNLPPESDLPLIGGFVEFARLATGQWVVARWAIRTPHMARQRFGGSAIPGGGQVDRAVIAAVGVTGGEVVAARRGTTSLYAADRSLIANEGSSRTVAAQPSVCGAGRPVGTRLGGIVSAGKSPVSGAVVRVAWPATDAVAAGALSTVTDAKGGYTVACVPVGVALTLSASGTGGVAGPEQVPPLKAPVLIDIALGPKEPQS